jgi:hypothetical protein
VHLVASGSPARRALRDGAVLAGLLFAAYLFLIVAPASGTFGFDAYAYWSVDPSDPYQSQVGGLAAFNYSPVIATVFGAFKILPWPAFIWLWTALQLATVVWLGGSRFLWLLAFPPVALEIYHGNVHLLIAACIVLGFRYPASWAFILLTKVTPGVGLLWFVFRREWRSLAIALGVTAAIAIPTMILRPELWFEWFEALLHAQGGPQLASGIFAVPLIPRLVVAVVLLWWGARSDRTWVVPIAVALGLPVLWDHGMAIMLASIWLAMHPRWGLPREVTASEPAAPAVTTASDPAAA